MIQVNLFKIVVLIFLAVRFGLAEGAGYALGAIETDLIGTAKPTHIDEIRRLRSLASIQATSQLLGEIVAIAQAQPSNALLGRVVKTNWTVFAYDVNTGLVVPNVDFILQPLRPAINSGGHDHDLQARPLGALSAYSGNSGPTGMGLVIQYTSPDVSGTVYSDSSCTGPNGFSCFLGQFSSFTTQVPNLGNLDPDITYDLIGSTGLHLSNHWGSTTFLAALRGAAILYFLKYNAVLAINDISLEFGGLFDVNGDWNNPHREHRLGVVGDLRIVPVAHQAALKQMLKDVGIVGPLLVHGPPAPHWHIREYNSHE